MRYLRFKNWPIPAKIFSVYILMIGGIYSGINYYYLPHLGGLFRQEKREGLKGALDIVYTLVQDYKRRKESGELTEEEARKRAMLRIGSIRYAGDNYFWITDANRKLIMHPFLPNEVGRDVSEYKDPAGTKIFREFVQAAKEKGEGYVNYVWRRNGATEASPKIAIVRYYPDWNWVVGTGIYVGDINARIETIRSDLLLGALYFSVASLLIVFLVSLFITRPLRSAIRASHRIEEGDLTVALKANSVDETGTLLGAMNGVVEKLNVILDTIVPTSLSIDDITGGLKEIARSASEKAHDQTQRSEEIASAADEMNRTIVDIAQNAARARATADSSLEKTNSGKSLAHETVRTMDNMGRATQELSATVHRLNQRMGDIGQVVTMIKEIADQTNLLALNAAIEAARAGGSGTRFAVVSDEVRKLAERTIKATEDIAENVTVVAGETEKTQKTMEMTAREVDEASEKISQMAEFLNTIAQAFANVRDQISQIASSVEQQSAASEQVAQSSEHSLSNAKEIEAQSQKVEEWILNLTRVADRLRESTVGVKTRANRALILDLARTDHRIFMERVNEHLKGRLMLQATDITDYHDCRFGKWYYSEGKEVAGDLKIFRDIEEPHSRIHDVAREVVRLKNSGGEQKAGELFHDLEQISHQMQDMLQALKGDYQKKVELMKSK